MKSFVATTATPLIRAPLCGTGKRTERGALIDLLDEIFDEGPKTFEQERLMQIRNLFQQRNALYYTPTQNIPDDLIGHGKLDIELPLSVPTIQECSENVAYRAPRLWVDLIQRATGKLRWRPFHPARVTIISYDANIYPVNAPLPKALIDALKFRTSGRRDGKWLYYFGAIKDDGPEDIESFLYQAEVDKPNQAHCRVIVEAIPSGEKASFTHTQSLLPPDFEL